MRRTKISTICTAIAVLLSVISCSKETDNNQEISVFECVYTDTDGRTCASSEVLYWLEREDFSPNVYAEGGRIWVKGSEDIKNIRKGIEERISECNEKIKGYGAFSYWDYSPVWKPSAGTKGESKTFVPIEVSSEELQKLVEQLVSICKKYPLSGIHETLIQAFFGDLCERFKPLTVDKVLALSFSFTVFECIMPGMFIHSWDIFSPKEHFDCLSEISDTVFEFCIAKFIAAA